MPGSLPLVEGNKDQWPVGSIASHIVSRVIGEDQYAARHGRRGADELARDGRGAARSSQSSPPYVNPSINALADDEAKTQFFLRRP